MYRETHVGFPATHRGFQETHVGFLATHVGVQETHIGFPATHRGCPGTHGGLPTPTVGFRHPQWVAETRGFPYPRPILMPLAWVAHRGRQTPLRFSLPRG